MKCVLMMVLLSVPVMASAVPDGAWNGKLWQRSELLAGVEKGDADALAEWAYCSRRGLLELPFDPKLIYERARKAADLGSVAGKRLAAKCVRLGLGVETDQKKGFAETELVAGQDCPDAWVDMAYDYMDGSMVPEKDQAKAEALLEKAGKEGSFRAVAALGALTADKSYHGYDLKESYRLKVKSLQMSKDVFTAKDLYHTVVYGSRRSYGEIITRQVLAQAREAIEKGMLLDHPSAYFAQSFYELDTPNGDKHRGVMLQIRSANLGNAAAMKNLTRWLGRGRKKRYAGKYQMLAMGSYWDSLKSAKYAYDRGERSNTVVFAYGCQLARDEGKGHVEKHKLAEKLLKKVIANGDCNAHDQLGNMRLLRHEKFNAPKEEAELGLSHVIYHSNHSDLAVYIQVYYYCMHKEMATYDLVKGAAASHYYLEKLTSEKQPHRIRLAKRWIKVVSEFTDEQKQEYQRLVDTGFPAGEPYRRAAFEKLKKAGDLPADWKFDQ